MGISISFYNGNNINCLWSYSELQQSWGPNQSSWVPSPTASSLSQSPWVQPGYTAGIWLLAWRTGVDSQPDCSPTPSSSRRRNSWPDAQHLLMSRTIQGNRAGVQAGEAGGAQAGPGSPALLHPYPGAEPSLSQRHSAAMWEPAPSLHLTPPSQPSCISAGKPALTDF